MKLKVYCVKCGALHEYVSEKPNFCQKCGAVFAHAKVQGITPSVDTEEQEENQNEQSTSISPTMTGLDYELEILSSQQTGPTLGELGGSPPEKRWTNKELGIKGKRGRPKKIKKDEVLKEFQKEAGALKQKPK